MSDKKKDERGFFGKLQSEFWSGLSILGASLDSGLNTLKSKPFLLAKYTIFTLVVAFIYVALIVQLPEATPYLSYVLFAPLAVLMLMFHHELFSLPVKDIGRFIYNSIVLAAFFLIIYLLFSYTASHQAPPGTEDALQAQSPLVLVSSTIAIFLFVLFLFLPLYMVKAGSAPFGAVRSAFKFLSKNAIKGVSYVVVLLMALSTISSLPSLVGLTIISPIIFVFLSYGVFIFISSFWEQCRNS